MFKWGQDIGIDLGTATVIAYVKGKGIVSMKNPSVYGDQYVSVQIQVPRALSPEEKKKLQEFAFLNSHRGRYTNAQGR